MSIFSLFGQKKPKSDLYWEFDKSTHFKPKLSKGDFFKLSGFDFGWFVLEPLSEYLQGNKGEIKKGKNLSYGQKALYYWWYVDAQVKNGGFTQYYYNDYGKYTPTIIKALNYIGDNKMAELVNRSYELYLKENRKIKDARTKGLEGFSKLYEQVKDFDSLDDEYYDINTQTMKKIESYIRNNPSEFCLDEKGNDFDMSFSGELITYYKDGNVKEKIPLSKGVISGTLTSYYKNKNLKEKIEFNSGEQTGERIKFFKNGNEKYIVTKDLIKKQYKHRRFFKNGNPKKLEHKQFKNGERIGKYKKWYKNGQLSENGTYISDYKRVGKWLEYYENGNNKVNAEFKNGNFLIHSCWDENGKQILSNGSGLYAYEYSIFEGEIERKEQEYKNYKRHGTQKTFNNGKLSLYQEMVDGKEHGITKSYDENGKLQSEAIYENGIEVSQKDY